MADNQTSGAFSKTGIIVVQQAVVPVQLQVSCSALNNGAVTVLDGPVVGGSRREHPRAQLSRRSASRAASSAGDGLRGEAPVRSHLARQAGLLAVDHQAVNAFPGRATPQRVRAAHSCAERRASRITVVFASP